MTNDTITDGQVPAISLAQAGVILAGLLLLLAIYIAAGSALGLGALFAGNLFLFYWAGINELSLPALPAAVVGSLAGIANGALFAILPPLVGTVPAVAIGLLVLIAAIYILILRRLPLVFNNAYMLQINVVLIPPVLSEGKFIGMAIAVAFSAAFWGGLVLAGELVRRRRGAAATVA